MIITIDKMLIKRQKTLYWLSKEINCDYQSLKKLVNNETSKVSLYMIENICHALDCTPNQIFKIENKYTAKEDCNNTTL
jgi:putative transcriptional regulator